MIKKSISLSILLAWSCFITATPIIGGTFILKNNLLKAADQGGLFNAAIIDIIKVRQKVKEFILGKLIWHGATCNFSVIKADGTATDVSLAILMKRPETLFGASFIVVTPAHPLATQLTTPETQDAVHAFIKKSQQKTVAQRYDNIDNHAIATGLYTLNPFTHEKMPIFISDYIIEGYDARHSHGHVGVPAHDHNDFTFAHQHKLPIKLVITSFDPLGISNPQFHKTTKQLIEAYPGDYDDCTIINSDFLNGSIKDAHDAAVAYIVQNQLGTEYQKTLIYQTGNKHYSIHELYMIEQTLQKEKRELSGAQKELFSVLMAQAQADFLTIVEQFLVNAKNARELMVELVEESCTVRNNKDAYLIKWANLNSSEPEKYIFKRDIINFTNMHKFCTELIDFLGDFASSCTNALEAIKNLKHS
ncbi:class I tRNA ligase family protein [Candidatus Babeliales bacterium]|nr:class I tRNA ligase family protein [Candidatus Babeliales bacterium]